MSVENTEFPIECFSLDREIPYNGHSQVFRLKVGSKNCVAVCSTRGKEDLLGKASRLNRSEIEVSDSLNHYAVPAAYFISRLEAGGAPQIVRIKPEIKGKTLQSTSFMKLIGDKTSVADFIQILQLSRMHHRKHHALVDVWGHCDGSKLTECLHATFPIKSSNIIREDSGHLKFIDCDADPEWAGFDTFRSIKQRIHLTEILGANYLLETGLRCVLMLHKLNQKIHVRKRNQVFGSTS